MNPWEKSISFAPIANSSSSGLEPYNDHTRAAMLEALTSALTCRTMMTNGWSRLPRSTAKGTLRVAMNSRSAETNRVATLPTLIPSHRPAAMWSRIARGLHPPLTTSGHTSFRFGGMQGAKNGRRGLRFPFPRAVIRFWDGSKTSIYFFNRSFAKASARTH